VKLSELNEATPLFEVVANSAAIVKVFEAIVVSIPSPPVIIKVSPRAIASSVELSSLIVNVLFANLALVTELSTNCEALIVLFVNVCVPVVVTNVLGKVIVLDDKSKVVANLPAVTALLAILPSVTAVSANWLVPIPEALTCKASLILQLLCHQQQRLKYYLFLLKRHQLIFGQHQRIEQL